jgi:methylated-DNA-[protein]-cysteine S-methyltransferase
MNMHEIYTVIDSPVGPLLLSGDGERLRLLLFASRGSDQRFGRAGTFPHGQWRHEPEAFTQARRQLREYFDGTRREFDLELDMRGSEFELKVWSALTTIPYGETRSYGEIARQITDDITASRAVGLANGRNPVSIIVPCHRVIGADGSLTGYGGGLDRKRTLLDLEAGRLALL